MKCDCLSNKLDSAAGSSCLLCFYCPPRNKTKSSIILGFNNGLTAWGFRLEKSFFVCPSHPRTNVSNFLSICSFILRIDKDSKTKSKMTRWILGLFSFIFPVWLLFLWLRRNIYIWTVIPHFFETQRNRNTSQEANNSKYIKCVQKSK